jgi:hypothetical protein
MCDVRTNKLKMEIKMIKKILTVVFMFLLLQLTPAQDTQIDKELEKFKLRLGLTEMQITKIQGILQEVQQQKSTDQKTYKKDAPALINAAWTRRSHMNKEIESILDSQQLEEFKRLRKLHPVDRELFVLTEGLFLNEEQIFDVEGVLIRMYNEIEPLNHFMEMMGEGGLPPGSSGGEIDPGGKDRMEPMPMRRGRGRMAAGFIKKIEAKKAKAIKKYLTDEQKALYEQIRKDRHQRMKKQLKRMKERKRQSEDS